MIPRAYLLQLLLFSYAASTFCLGILTPIYAFFVQKLGGGVLETAWSIALFSMVTGVITIVIYKIPFVKQYRTEVLFIGWFIWLVSIVMYCSMSTLHVLYWSQFLGALGSALSGAAFDAEYSDMGQDDLLDAWALFEGVTSIASGIASLVAGVLVHYYGLKSLMVCMAAAGMLSFFILFYYELIKRQYV